MKVLRSKYFILLILVLLFAAPGISAYLFYKNPKWLSATKVNRGVLLQPPEQLQALDTENKWRIVYWKPGACTQSCLAKIDLLARVRLALGRRLYEVDQWLILEDNVPPLSQYSLNFIKQHDFHVAYVSTNQLKLQKALGPNAAIYLANPDKYLVLKYPSALHPDDVFNDLNLLLKNSQQKSG